MVGINLNTLFTIILRRSSAVPEKKPENINSFVDPRDKFEEEELERLRYYYLLLHEIQKHLDN